MTVKEMGPVTRARAPAIFWSITDVLEKWGCLKRPDFRFHAVA
jgi:hypothetical protein